MMENNLSTDQVRMLAEAERMMDAGERPFVRLGGERVMVAPEVMEELGLEPGQTISNAIFGAILEAQLASVRAQIAMRDATLPADQEGRDDW